jgi:hypothetical protein
VLLARLPASMNILWSDPRSALLETLRAYFPITAIWS